MSDLRIQVCEWLGWDVLETTVGTTGRTMGRKPGTDWMLLPELTLDLMAQAEARLTLGQLMRYEGILKDIVLDDWRKSHGDAPSCRCFHFCATAEQRATALLRAVGKGDL